MSCLYDCLVIMMIVMSCFYYACHFLSLWWLSCLFFSFSLWFLVWSCLYVACLVLSCLDGACLVFIMVVLSLWWLSGLIFMMIVLSCLVFMMIVLSGLVLIVIVLSGAVWSGLVWSCRVSILPGLWSYPPFSGIENVSFGWRVCVALYCTCTSGESYSRCFQVSVVVFILRLSSAVFLVSVDLLNLNNLLHDSF